jgi:predicted DNA-binding antitoxin AbrB/MazE fold protein
MEKTVQAVHIDGVLRPLEPIALEDQQEVTVTIFYEGTLPPNHPLLVSSDEWASAARDVISRFSILEIESVLALKFRTGEISEHALLCKSRSFRSVSSRVCVSFVRGDLGDVASDRTEPLI